MIETWKDIPGYEGYYQVSNLGHVKSIPRYKMQTVFRRSGMYNSEVWRYKGKELTPIREGSIAKHIKVRLYDSFGVRKGYYVSHLVLQCFNPTVYEEVRNKRAIITYVDNDMYNCAISNLYVIPKIKRGTK